MEGSGHDDALDRLVGDLGDDPEVAVESSTVSPVGAAVAATISSADRRRTMVLKIGQADVVTAWNRRVSG